MKIAISVMLLAFLALLATGKVVCKDGSCNGFKAYEFVNIQSVVYAGCVEFYASGAAGFIGGLISIIVNSCMAYATCIADCSCCL